MDHPKSDGERFVRMLKDSGASDETLREVATFWKNFDEAQDLWSRLPGAFPRGDPKAAELRARWEKKDPNVVKYDNGPDEYPTFELVFTKEQKGELIDGYLNLRPKVENYPPGWEHQATVFVNLLESWGNSIREFQAIEPPDQKARKQAFTSVANAVEKLDQALSSMDSEALGWWYSHVVDKVSPLGVQVSREDGQVVAMREERLRRVVEAGEWRQQFRLIAGAVVEATKEAADTLPKHEHVESDVRLGKALALERQMIENQLPFEATETSYAAKCLRAMFDLASLDVEKVSYWLRKAKDSPRSHAKWLQSLADRAQKTEGENPPPV